MPKKYRIIHYIVTGGMAVIAVVFILILWRCPHVPKEDEEIVTTQEAVEQTESRLKPALDEVINLAFFGIDTRDVSAEIGDQYRSDSIMVVSINTKTNKVKFISIMRDSKVPIEGHGPQKINAAYQYGGEELAIQTLNQTFNLQLEKFVTVDFGQLRNVVDAMGGVEVELTAEEAAIVNDYAYGDFGYDKFDATEGLQTLNGAQAVSYSRIRSLDSDYTRVSRQRTVLNALLTKVKGMTKLQSLGLALKVLGLVRTNLSIGDVTDMAQGINISALEIENYTVPDYDANPELWGGIDETGSWVWIYDLEASGTRINKIINEEE